MKTAINEKGYHRIGLVFDGKRKMYRLHRLVALAFIENPENKPEVNHKDGNKDCNFIWNLEWSTHKENVRHSSETNLNMTKGEENYNAKITEETVLEVRRLYELGGHTHRSLAIMFGINHASIGCIVRRDTWKHI